MIIIGEKINGTIPVVAEAIRTQNDKFIGELAVRQADAGADYIDICAGTSSDVELQTLEWLVNVVESAVPTPICIDSPDAMVLTKIIPSIKKEGIVNSVSGEGDKCELVYPLIARTGWGVIALTCDDSGIPQDPDRKASIASLLVEKALNYGISEEQIYIDPLVMSLSSVNDALLSFCDTLKKIRKKYSNVKFTSGLSNISFGMPCRKYVNRNFLAYAIQAGMDSAIMDPTNKDMYATVIAAEALLGRDKYCRKYYNAYRAGKL